MSRDWTLHPQLHADTHAVASLELCDVRLMDDARFPWLVLVPRIAGAVEWVDLDVADRHRLDEEIARCAAALRQVRAPHKLNIGALGNVVSQLHVHVVGRFHGDEAWPRPVWGSGEARRYASGEAAALIATLRERLTS
ncbi:MAG TPA: HIT domain-containing protein [Lysobacter sp.]